MLILTGSGPEQSGVSILARILGSNGQIATPGSMASIAYTVTDLMAGLIVSTGSVPLAALSTMLLIDPRWTLDATGYNFLATIPATAFPLTPPAANVYGIPPPVNVYQIDLAFTPVSGQPFRVIGKYTAGATFG